MTSEDRVRDGGSSEQVRWVVAKLWHSTHPSVVHVVMAELESPALWRSETRLGKMPCCLLVFRGDAMSAFWGYRFLCLNIGLTGSMIDLLVAGLFFSWITTAPSRFPLRPMNPDLDYEAPSPLRSANFGPMSLIPELPGVSAAPPSAVQSDPTMSSTPSSQPLRTLFTQSSTPPPPDDASANAVITRPDFSPEGTVQPSAENTELSLIVRPPPLDSHPVRKGPKGARHLQPKAAPGRKSSWPPKKLAWLTKHIPEFLSTQNTSDFYDRVLLLWFKIFGRALPVKDDPDFDIDEEAALTKPAIEENLTDEERTIRSRQEQELRLVRFSLLMFVWLLVHSLMAASFLQTIANWYRNSRVKAQCSRSKKGSGMKLITSGESTTLPRRLAITRYYISRYWETRILQTYVTIRDRNLEGWNSMVARGQIEGKKKPTSIVALNEAVSTKWAEETDEFKAQLVAERDSERKAAEEGLHRLMSPADGDRTPEEYQQYVLFSLLLFPFMFD